MDVGPYENTRDTNADLQQVYNNGVPLRVTIYNTPLRYLDTVESWNWWARCGKSVYQAAGGTPADRMFFAFDGHSRQDHWLGRSEIPVVAGRLLVMPFDAAGLCVERDERGKI